VRRGRRARTDAGTARLAALDAALRTALQSLVVSVADRAAEQVARVWRDNPGGAALITAAEASRARDEHAKREFESAFGSPQAEQSLPKPGAFDRASADLPLRVSRAVSAWQDQLMRLTSSGGVTGSSRGGHQPPGSSHGGQPESGMGGSRPLALGMGGSRPPALGMEGSRPLAPGMEGSRPPFPPAPPASPAPPFPLATPTAPTPPGRNPRGAPDGKATGTGMQFSGASKQEGPVSVITLVALLGQPSQPGQAAGFAQAARAQLPVEPGEGRNEIGTLPQETIASLIGSAESAALIDRARQDLNQRVGLLLDEEMIRFSEIIDEVGPVDSVAAVRLYQAEYSLEAAR
jgi:hypothetical protein